MEYAPPRKHNSQGPSHGSSQGASDGTSRSASRGTSRAPKSSTRNSYSSDDDDDDDDDGQGSVESSSSESVEGNEDATAMDILMNIGNKINAISTRLDRIEDHMRSVPHSAVSTSTSSTASSDAMPSEKLQQHFLFP